MRRNHAGRFILHCVGILSTLALLLAVQSASAFEPESVSRGGKTQVHPKRIEDAREYFREGLALYEAAKYEEAGAKFERAQRVAPNYRLKYNLALVRRELNDPAAAIRLLEEYADEGAWEIPDDRVAEVTRLISELNPRVGVLHVTSKVVGAQVSLNGRFVGQAPLPDSVPVNPGPVEVSAKLDGYVGQSKSIKLAAGEVANIEFQLEPLIIPFPTLRVGSLTALLLVVIFLVWRTTREEPATTLA